MCGNNVCLQKERVYVIGRCHYAISGSDRNAYGQLSEIESQNEDSAAAWCKAVAWCEETHKDLLTELKPNNNNNNNNNNTFIYSWLKKE